MLYLIERIKNEQISFKTDADSDFSIIVKFKQEIIKDLDQQLTIDDFANRLGTSTKKSTSLTKQYTSLTPGPLISKK